MIRASCPPLPPCCGALRKRHDNHPARQLVNIRRAGSTPEKGRDVVPTKQTKEAIEAELNASERERIALQLQEVARDIDIVEKELRALEDARGIPDFNRSKPLPERMAARGMRQATIERISTFMERKAD